MPMHSSYGLNVILLTATQTWGEDQFLPEKALGLYFWLGLHWLPVPILKKKKKQLSFYNMLAAFLFKEL